MRLAVRALIGLAALVAVWAPPAPAAADRCPRSGMTLAENGRLRVYEHSWSYYVCDRRTGRRVVIGEGSASSSGYIYIGPAAVAGRVAAWQEVWGESPFIGCKNSNSLHVRDFGRRRKLASIELRRNGEVKELVVKRNGSLAWIEERPVSDDGCSAERTYLVRRRDARGNTVLAAGDDEPHDLRLAGSRLTWSDGTGTHSASIR